LAPIKGCLNSWHV